MFSLLSCCETVAFALDFTSGLELLGERYDKSGWGSRNVMSVLATNIFCALCRATGLVCKARARGSSLVFVSQGIGERPKDLTYSLTLPPFYVSTFFLGCVFVNFFYVDVPCVGIC